MLFWLLIALALDKAQLIIAQPGYGSPYCGIGTIDGVLQRRTHAPMAYRVLVPWLIGLVERVYPRARRQRLSVYETFKIVLMGLALWAVASATNDRTAFIVAALLPMTFSFDYWDYAVEIGALAMAVGGNMPGALIGGVLLALSRETAPLVPAAYLLATGDAPGTFVVATGTALTMLGVRLWAGRHELYCDRWMIKRNLTELRAALRCSPPFMGNAFLSVLLCAIVLALAVLGRLGPTWPIPLAIVALGWAWGISYETRIFSACLLWIGMAL